MSRAVGSAPGEGSPTGADTAPEPPDMDGYFGKALLTFRDRDGLKWTAGLLVAPMICEGLEESVPLTKEIAEERGLVATKFVVLYEDDA